ncbi:hypothetical protein [Teichococcus aestuarii]
MTASEEPIPLPGQRAPAFVVRKPFCARHRRWRCAMPWPPGASAA